MEMSPVIGSARKMRTASRNENSKERK